MPCREVLLCADATLPLASVRWVTLGVAHQTLRSMQSLKSDSQPNATASILGQVVLYRPEDTPRHGVFPSRA